MTTGAPDQTILSHIDAIEAKLNAVRELHKPVDTGMFRIGPGGNRGPVIECHTCLLGVDVYGCREWLDWPCETARIVYGESEIKSSKEVPR